MFEISVLGTVLDFCVAGSNSLVKLRRLAQIAVGVGYFVKEKVISYDNYVSIYHIHYNTDAFCS